MAERGHRAARSPGAWAVVILTLALGLTADLWTKSWAFRTVGTEPVLLNRERLLSDPSFDPVGYHPSRSVLPGNLLSYRLVLNPGAVFGIGAHQRWFFIVFTVAALVGGLLLFGRYTTARNRVAHIAIGLVLAGGLGNLYDRLAIGRVRDFIHALPERRLPFGWTWPGTNNPEMFPWVFNVADMLLLAGMIALMMHVNAIEKRRKESESAGVSESADSVNASS